MATFFSNQTIWYWGSTAYPVKGTLTGNVSRSGNTVTLSGMSLSLSWPAAAYGTYAVSFTVNGTTTSRSVAANTGSFAVNSTSFGVSSTQTSANVGWSSSDGYSGSFTVTFPSGDTPPSGASMSFVSSTWNSVTLKGRVTNWGSGTGPSRHFSVIVTSVTGNTDWDGKGRREKYISGNSTSDGTATISNSSYDAVLDGGINIRGCLAYKCGMWYGTSVAGYCVGDYNIRYLPPSPLQTLSKTSESYAGSNKSNVTLSITGGNSTNNNNVSVSTQYRYSTNGGSSWTAWAAAGTGTPWTTKTAMIQVPCNTSIQVQARQVYQSQASETKSLTFTSMKTPVALYVPVSSKSKKAQKVYISVSGKSKKALKIYKGVSGKSKLVYTD